MTAGRGGRAGRGRQWVLVGTAVVVLVLVGIAGVNVLRNDPGGPPVTLPASPPGVSVPPAAPDATQDVIPPDTPYMAVPPGTNPPEWLPAPAPLAVPDAVGCAARQDPALRALVDEALPEVVGAPGAPVVGCPPADERHVAIEVDGGVLTVAYVPPGRPVDGRARTAVTASGGIVAVFSRPAREGGPAPFADRFDEVALFLAPRL